MAPHIHKSVLRYVNLVIIDYRPNEACLLAIHGESYPEALAPCHAPTLIVARATALSGTFT